MTGRLLPLKPAERKFIERLAADPNATRSELYREVFELPDAVSNKCARERACRLMKKPQAQEYLDELRADARKEARFSIQRAHDMLMAIHDSAMKEREGAMGATIPPDHSTARQCVMNLCELHGVGAKYEGAGNEEARKAVVLLPARTDNQTFQELADAWLAEAEERQKEMMQYVSDRTH